jgi:hypothetical protein
MNATDKAIDAEISRVETWLKDPVNVRMLASHMVLPLRRSVVVDDKEVLMLEWITDLFKTLYPTWSTDDVARYLVDMIQP